MFLWGQVLNKRRPHVSNKTARVTYYSKSRVRDHRRSLFRDSKVKSVDQSFALKWHLVATKHRVFSREWFWHFVTFIGWEIADKKRLRLSAWSTKKLHRVKETRLSRKVSALNSVSRFVSNSQLMILQIAFSHCLLGKSKEVWNSNWRWKFFRLAPSNCLVSWLNKCTNR